MLRPPVLLLPLVIAWFICGAYPGHIVSVLLMAGLFVVAQAALGSGPILTTVLARDAAIQLAGMGQAP